MNGIGCLTCLCQEGSLVDLLVGIPSLRPLLCTWAQRRKACEKENFAHNVLFSKKHFTIHIIMEVTLQRDNTMCQFSSVSLT
jgi:hypothetical protein